MATEINYSFYADLGFYVSIEVAAVGNATDTTSTTELTVGVGVMDISETISFTELDIGGAGYETFFDSITMSEVIDARVRGALKTLFISDERYFLAKPKPTIRQYKPPDIND